MKILDITQNFRDIFFNSKHKINEDCLYTQSIMERTDSACLSDLELYHWFFRENSASQTKVLEPDFLNNYLSRLIVRFL